MSDGRLRLHTAVQCQNIVCDCVFLCTNMQHISFSRGKSLVGKSAVFFLVIAKQLRSFLLIFQAKFDRFQVNNVRSANLHMMVFLANYAKKVAMHTGVAT